MKIKQILKKGTTVKFPVGFGWEVGTVIGYDAAWERYQIRSKDSGRIYRVFPWHVKEQKDDETQ